MSNQKLKCSQCKKLKLNSEFSNRQRQKASNRLCITCAQKKSEGNLSLASPGRLPCDSHFNEVGLDGKNWEFDATTRLERKPITYKSSQDPLRERTPHNRDGINAHTDKVTPFAMLAPKTQSKKLNEVKDKLIEACDGVLNGIEDIDLKTTAKVKFASPLYDTPQKRANNNNNNSNNLGYFIEIDTNSKIQQGLRDCYHSIPSNSPIRASFIKSIFPVNLEPQFIADTLDIDVSCVYKSLNSEVEHLDYYLRELGFIRDRLGERRTDLEDWFVKRCGPPSGRHKRYYTYGMRTINTSFQLLSFISAYCSHC